jgi:hypothetical protein
VCVPWLCWCDAECKMLHVNVDVLTTGRSKQELFKRFLVLRQVAAFVTILDKDLTRRGNTAEVEISPLLHASTSSLCKQQLEKRIKSVPLAFYPVNQTPTTLFTLL